MMSWSTFRATMILLGGICSEMPAQDRLLGPLRAVSAEGAASILGGRREGKDGVGDHPSVFFAVFDTRRRVQEALVNNHSRYCDYRGCCSDLYIGHCRAQLSNDLVRRLHSQIAKILDLLRWHHTVCKSYQWHMKLGPQR